MKLNTLLCGLMLLTACIEAYEPTVAQGSQNQSLIVDAILSNDPSITRVILSSAKALDDPELIKGVSGAQVELIDEKGERFKLTSNGKGRYRFLNDEFQPQFEVQYRLYIKLENGEEYISENQKLLEPVALNNLSVKYEFMQANVYGEVRNVEFVAIYEEQTLSPSDSEFSYFWHDYFGTIGFRAPYQGSDVCEENGTRFPVQEDDVVCYKEAETFWPTNIFSTENTNNSASNRLLLIHPDYDFLESYDLFVRRFRVSKEAYEYLSAINKLSNYEGGLFDPPPFKLVGNIYKVDDPTDFALGFFAAASRSVASRSVFVDGSEIDTSSFINFKDPACFNTVNNLELSEEQIDRPPMQCCDCRIFASGSSSKLN